MKKLLVGMLSLVVLAVAGGSLWYWGYLPRQQPTQEWAVEATPELIERGRYLTINVFQCVDCHSERDWTLYGGPPVEPIGAGRECMDKNSAPRGVNVGETTFPGRMCIRNITQDVETGIGGWTNGEIVRAVREGVDRDGNGLFPIMPYFIYRHIADEDIRAMLAYLRSMPAVKSIRPEKEIEFPMSSMVQLWPEPVTEAIVAPPPSDTVAYGEYVSRVARCEFCHTPRNPRSFDTDPARHLAGGMPFFLNGKTLWAMNLTPHKTGLGSWTREQFLARFKLHGTPTPVAPEANTLMNWNAFAGMSEADVNALWDYFMSVPPVEYRREDI